MTNKSTLPGYIPVKVVKNCSGTLCIPMSHMINHSINTGMWPDSYKFETITTIGKQHPVELLDQLRPISSLTLCDKIQESIISDLVISDMNDKLDPSQYDNQKKPSIQQYLLKIMDQIVTNVDRNSRGEINAVLATFVDCQSAYSRQDHTLGSQFFFKEWCSFFIYPTPD